MSTSTDWRELAADKKRRQQESIPKQWIISTPPDSVQSVYHTPETCGLLTERELEITNAGIDDLLSKLASAEWSSVDATTAFYKRAIIAHQVTNCLTEIFVDRALARAAELDDHLKKTGKVIGPLHGLPISLKDQFAIKGLETTMGYVSWIGKYADRDAVLVELLYNCGAVPFVRTNVPQTLMWPETFNNIFGRTTNPRNRLLSAGGSSGGEGVLATMRGSPLGVGSDVGGSIRVPASYNGVYGFRPSFGRIPYAGAVNSLEGQEAVPSVFGPISNSLEGVKIFMRAIIEQKPWLKDPLSPRKKWDEDEYQLADHGHGKGLCFAVMWNDGVVVPHPPVTRAMEITKKALLAAGHKVIDWKPYKHEQLNNTISQIWGAGMAEDLRVTTAPTGEPVISTMRMDVNTALVSSFRPTDKIVSAYDLWQIHRERRDLRREYLDHWEQTVSITGTGRPVDAIIAPIAAHGAPPHGKHVNVDYTMIWNTLDYPALAFPVTTVDPVLDAKKPAHAFLSEADRTMYEFYDGPETFKDSPIGLQLVGRTLEEEAVIALTEIVDEALRRSS